MSASATSCSCPSTRGTTATRRRRSPIVWGRSGVGNLFQPGVTDRRVADVRAVQRRVRAAYNTDTNNWAPNLGFAWTVGGNPAIPRARCSATETATACCAPATRWATTGRARRISPARSTTIPASSLTANRNHALNNLGTPGSIFLRDPAPRSAAANMPHRTHLPADRRRHRRHHGLRPDTAGAVRDDVDRRLAAQADARHGRRGALRRHALARSRGRPTTTTRSTSSRTASWTSSGARRQNLRANIAARHVGNTFRVHAAPPGTSPLPIFLAHFNGVGAAGAGNPANYTGTNWTSTTFLGFLAEFNPQPASRRRRHQRRLGLIGNADVPHQACRRRACLRTSGRSTPT